MEDFSALLFDKKTPLFCIEPFTYCSTLNLSSTTLKFLQNINETFPFSACDISLLPPDRLNDVIVLFSTPWMSLLERIVKKHDMTKVKLL